MEERMTLREKTNRTFVLLTVSLFILCGMRANAIADFYDDFSSSTLRPEWQTSPGGGSYSLTANPGYLRYYSQGRNTADGSPPVWGPTLGLIVPFEGTQWVLKAEATYHLRYTVNGGSTGGQGANLVVGFGDDMTSSVYRDDLLTIERGVDAWYGVNSLIARASDDPGVSGLVDVRGLLAPDDVVVNEWVTHTYSYEITRNADQLGLRYSYDGLNFIDVFTVTFPNGLADMQRLRLDAGAWATAGSYVDWNYVSVEQVPVPGAVLLGALGLSCAGWRLRRRTV
jgi:hypothetical protein